MFADARALVDELLDEYLAQPESLSIDVWADQKRQLSTVSSKERGQWRTDRTPYMRQIYGDLSPQSPHQLVVLLTGTQLGKSEAGLNWTGSTIDQDPGPMMIVQPTLDMAKRYSKQRLSPMIEATPALRRKIRPSRSRDSGNTTLLKEFADGLLVLAGANSAASLASMPVRYIHCDEIDDYPLDLDGQGSPLKIVAPRQDTFGRKRKTLYTSTPKRGRGLSDIENYFLDGTQFRYHVGCPLCGHYQPLVWGGPDAEGPGLCYPSEDPDAAAYVCAQCARSWAEHHKAQVLASGVWIAEHPERPIRSYRLSSLYSPLGWLSWAALCREHRDAKLKADVGDATDLRTWTNTRLAETVKDESGKIAEQLLRDRVEASTGRLRIVPAPLLVLTAGVDVQDNRLEVGVHGWGPGEENGLVDYVQIWGDTAQTERLPGGEPTVWERLDALFEKRYPHASGQTLAVEAVAIDTGGHSTHAVYSYCRDREAITVRGAGVQWVRRTFAIKGTGRPGLPIKGKSTPVDINWRGRQIKNGVKLWSVGVLASKDWWQTHLRLERPGPGYVHVPRDTPEEWIGHMASEQRALVRGARGQYWTWVLQPGRRNEGWDCAQYALFAAHALDLHRYTEAMWTRLIERVQQAELALSGAAEPAAAATSSSSAPAAGDDWVGDTSTWL